MNFGTNFPSRDISVADLTRASVHNIPIDRHWMHLSSCFPTEVSDQGAKQRSWRADWTNIWQINRWSSLHTSLCWHQTSKSNPNDAKWTGSRGDSWNVFSPKCLFEACGSGWQFRGSWVRPCSMCLDSTWGKSSDHEKNLREIVSLAPPKWGRQRSTSRGWRTLPIQRELERLGKKYPNLKEFEFSRSPASILLLKGPMVNTAGRQWSWEIAETYAQSLYLSVLDRWHPEHAGCCISSSVRHQTLFIF